MANGGRHLKLVNIQYPFSLFYFSVVFSAVALSTVCYIYFQQTDFSSTAANTGLLTNSATLAISILGTFIPFVFAASTFARNRIANLVPQYIEKRCAGIADLVVWAFLGLLFLLSITLVLTSKGSTSTDVIHVLILALAFITVAAYVRAMLVISNAESLIPYFGYRSQRILKRLFWLQYPYPHIRGARLKRLVQINILGFYRCSSVIDHQPLDVAKDCQDEAIRTAEALIEMISRGIRANSALQSSQSLKHLEQYASAYFSYRSLCHSTSDAFNLYLTNEFKLLVKQTANECGEKHLDAISQSIRGIMLAACKFTGDSRFNVRQNGLISSWETLLSETIAPTAYLQNTVYVQTLIGALGDVGAALLEKGHDVSVEYGIIPTIENIANRFAESRFIYHNSIVNLALDSLINISTQWTIEMSRLRIYRDSRLLATWQKSMSNIIATKLNHYSTSFTSPFAAITGLSLQSQHQLLRCYEMALYRMRFESMQGDTQRLKTGNDSIPDESLLYKARIMRDSLAIFHKPLIDLLQDGVILGNENEWSQYTRTLTDMFWLDMMAINDDTGVTEEWTISATESYSRIFETIAKELIAIISSAKRSSRAYWLADLSDLCAIPAIGIILCTSQCKLFAESVITAFCDMLIDLFQNATDHGQYHERDRLKQYLLLVTAWLTANEFKLDIVEKMNSILHSHPMHLKSPIPFDSMSPLLQCYPRGPFHSDMWYLPPSEYWSTELQSEVNVKLMNRDMLEEFCKAYVAEHDVA